jgi:rubrerythrin
MAMGFTFNLCEIFDMAEAIERKGSEFYRKAAEIFKDTDMHETLLQLAEKEANHAIAFAAIRKSFSERECPPTAFDPDGELALYLQAMADHRICGIKDKNLCRELTGEESKEEILQLAIDREKEGLAFYLGLKDAVTKQSDKDKVEVIIKAKMRHIGLLSREPGTLNK